ncbi:phosphatidylserine decarboxylase [Pleurotus ostreatus]|nr:phosphatidylserine decarboxylase [Pleurotus ostreatus]
MWYALRNLELKQEGANTHATGSVKVKPIEALRVSAPPTDGVVAVRPHNAALDLEDDGGLSSEPSDEEDDTEEVSDYTTAASSPPTPPTPSEEKAAIKKLQTSGPKPVPPRLALPASMGTWTKFRRASSSNITLSSVMTSTPSTSTPSTPSATTPSSSNLDVGAPPAGKRKRFRKNKTHGEYYFGASHDIVGIVMREIHGADDLPRLENVTRTGWDIDPFVVISFGKKVFRTRVIRHSLNPVWDKKLLSQVRQYETAFKVQLSILDWD